MNDGAYFETLSKALRAAHIHQPCLILDLERLDANIAAVKTRLAAAGLPLRIVDKSLPSLALLDHISRALGTDRFMTFHLPISRAVLAQFPQANVLLGKPMPVGGARQALASGTARVTWLIDTPERLAAYGALAEELGVDIDFCFEVDIGLHRGGYPTPKALRRELATLVAWPRLRCQGIMAYEAHIGHVPRLFGGPKGALRRSKRSFAKYAALLEPGRRAVLNLGGSSTALLYDARVGANEIAMGSAFVKPSDFDVPSLGALVPAAFIATPILKVVDAKAPGLDDRSWILQKLGKFPRRGCFIYGGKWMAKPVYPPGLKANPVLGNSTNQQFMELPADTQAKPDDYAFLRPTQSEFVFQQFGPIAVYAAGKIIDRWPVIAPG